MIEITSLEKLIISIMLLRKNENLNDEMIINSISFISRDFSVDAINESYCCGFYLEFLINQNTFDLDMKKMISMQMHHADLTYGADFILFLDKGFLEATFYGLSLPIQRVLSKNHGFF